MASLQHQFQGNMIPWLAQYFLFLTLLFILPARVCPKQDPPEPMIFWETQTCPLVSPFVFSPNTLMEQLPIDSGQSTMGVHTCVQKYLLNLGVGTASDMALQRADLKPPLCIAHHCPCSMVAVHHCQLILRLVSCLLFCQLALILSCEELYQLPLLLHFESPCWLWEWWEWGFLWEASNLFWWCAKHNPRGVLFVM